MVKRSKKKNLCSWWDQKICNMLIIFRNPTLLRWENYLARVYINVSNSGIDAQIPKRAIEFVECAVKTYLILLYS